MIEYQEKLSNAGIEVYGLLEDAVALPMLLQVQSKLGITEKGGE